MVVLVLLQIILLLWPIEVSTQRFCPRACGNVSISYPFGIGKGCYFDKSFKVICNYSSGNYPKAYLPGINNLELLDGVSYEGTIRVNVPIISLKNLSNARGVNLSGSPLTFSARSNRFTAIGCDDYDTIDINNSTVSGGCLAISTCDPTSKRVCYDFLCALAPNITQVFNADLSYFYSQNISQKCRSVSVVEENWVGSKYLENPRVLKQQARDIPALLGWGDDKGSYFEEFNFLLYPTICGDGENGCSIKLSSGYICRCDPSTLVCISGNNCSKCPYGYSRSPRNSTYCYRNTGYHPYFTKKALVKYIIIGCSGGLGLLFLLVGIWRLYKFVKRRREIKLKQKFFKRNGGLLLQQELSSNESNIEKTKLFTSKDLEKATDNYNANRILGQGGQGTVYKGMLTDGRIVAVKKSKLVDETNVERFINEVVILSQINHRNIVKLLGCCLETEVPLLVYEFIPNGTLYQYIHNQIEEFPIKWELLSRIAVEVSGALFYLHSAASIPIYHRDIKSANILLDDKYRAKISDFGTSRSVMVDQTHLTTKVQGTFGYVDPEYFQSGQFTEKSDVYSFGVVLVEILTGQKPIRAINTNEDRSLVGYFLQAINENRLFEVLDARVLKEAKKEEIMTVATLAKRCLNLNGKMRPTMKEVTFELGGIKTSIGASILQQNCEEIDFVDGDISGHSLETGSSSIGMSILNSSSAFSIDAHPLLSNKWG
ncbi:putative wall-associated receptor kinase-like 11 [Citrus sinensis]|nr:putative wall-associated receptor kinase-like 11 [Citrus sinensis]